MRVDLNLMHVNEILQALRFDGLDQNPHGIRDLIGSASSDVALIRKRVTTLIRAIEALAIAGSSSNGWILIGRECDALRKLLEIEPGY